VPAADERKSIQKKEVTIQVDLPQEPHQEEDPLTENNEETYYPTAPNLADQSVFLPQSPEKHLPESAEECAYKVIQTDTPMKLEAIDDSDLME
jgi:hypothetical protein